jgi:hypothetical protein
MSGPFRTGPREFATVADSRIEALAGELLDAKQSNFVTEVCSGLLGSRARRRRAITQLQVRIGVRPSRPLFYLGFLHVRRLPTYTRDVVRYSADYVDLLTKELAQEVLDGRARSNSLGTNSRNLAQRGSPEHKVLFNQIERLNEFLYVPAKHDFSNPTRGRRRFTLREAVLSVIVCLTIGEKILEISKFARQAVAEDERYSMGGEGSHWEGVTYHPPGE